MKLIYLVYREDNVMVYESQVLEYLRALKEKKLFDSIELVVFRHEQNLWKKDAVEARIHKYIDNCMTFPSLPLTSMAQLDFSAAQLCSYLSRNYSKNERIAVICRGDLAAYVGCKAFSGFDNSRILYDNRGLAYEESVLSHKDSFIHTINRNIKREALNRSKSRVDMYNFVTATMRDFFLKQYGYDPNIPYTVIPTLYHAEKLDENVRKQISTRHCVSERDFVVSYVGSTAAWQSIQRLNEIIEHIGEKYSFAKFLILSNGEASAFSRISENIKRRLTVVNVPHSEMKYYLHMTDVGIIIRDNNIVNRVAAPTKVAEYLTNGVKVLYSGEIGIIDDLNNICNENQLICIDTDKDWIEKIKPDDITGKNVSESILSYFDMDKRQLDTFKMIEQSFDNPKIR